MVPFAFVKKVPLFHLTCCSMVKQFALTVWSDLSCLSTNTGSMEVLVHEGFHPSWKSKSSLVPGQQHVIIKFPKGKFLQILVSAIRPYKLLQHEKDFHFFCLFVWFVLHDRGKLSEDLIDICNCLISSRLTEHSLLCQMLYLQGKYLIAQGPIDF